MKDLLITLAVAVCGFVGTLAYLWEAPKPPAVAAPVLANSPALAPRSYESSPVATSGATAGEQVAERAFTAPAHIQKQVPPAAVRSELPSMPAPAESGTEPGAPLPVAVKFRRIHPGDEYQAGLINSSTRTLPLEVVISNTGGKQVNQQVQAAPGTGMSLGMAQGWQLEPGDQVTLRAAGYEDLTVRVP